MESHTIYSYMCDFFYSAWFWNSIIWHLSVISSFPLLKSIQSCRALQFVSIELWMDIWVFPTFRILWRKVLWVFNRHYTYTFLLGKYLGVELLGSKISLFLTLSETLKLFSKVAIPFCLPNKGVWEFLFLQIHGNIWYCISFLI